MVSLSEVTALNYTATLAEWAGQFSDLPGFVYLDSGTNSHGAELEIVTALTHRHPSVAGLFGEPCRMDDRTGDRFAQRLRPET